MRGGVAAVLLHVSFLIATTIVLMTGEAKPVFVGCAAAAAAVRAVDCA